MQVFELLFLALFAFAIFQLIFGPIHPRLTNTTVGFIGVVLFVLGVIFEGWRWQMFPAQLGFVLLLTASIGGPREKSVLKSFGAVVLVLLLTLTAFLAHQLPIRSLPEPEGPFGVGTFEYSVTDTSRVERFAPDRDRELYVEVWYPADRDSLSDYPVQSLFHELYEGDPTVWSFLFGYLRHIPTHSRIGAPLAEPASEAFPVLLFNHGFDGFTSQNQLLMEHLASHGYVVFSIAHPYQSIRVNLQHAGTVRGGAASRSDSELLAKTMGLDLLSKINQHQEDLTTVRRALLELVDDNRTEDDERAKKGIVTVARLIERLARYGHLLTEASLSDYLSYLYFDKSSAVEYWVEDIQFIADTLTTVDAPIDGFTAALDTSRLGIFGMSMGGAAAGEFCKIDDRCRAGANLDGTQGGLHADDSIGAPFLMIYHEEDSRENDFAYLPARFDFWDLTVAGTTHFDFVDIAHTMPLLKTLGLAGPIDSSRTIDIVNSTHLAFFDAYLKAVPTSVDWSRRFPEVKAREHLSSADARPLRRAR